MDDLVLENLKKELEMRRSILVSLAHEAQTPIDNTDRKNILHFLEGLNIPKKPNNEILLAKEFVSSCLSSNQPPYRMRNKLRKLIGEIPLANTIPTCLSKLFDNHDFLNDNNWKFNKLYKLSSNIKTTTNSSGMKSAILEILINGSIKMQEELQQDDLNIFYDKIANEIKKGPKNTWKFMEVFTKPIPGVGPGLFSDFLKNIGFVEFVKIDYHFGKEFPALTCSKNLTPKKQFILSIQLCDQLGITPFHFDHIMYQWGSYKSLVK